MAYKKQIVFAPLSPREILVLAYIQKGFHNHNKDIIKILYVSNNTVKSHIKNIYSKMNVNNRVQAILKGKELGYIK